MKLLVIGSFVVLSSLLASSCFMEPPYVSSYIEANAVWSESDDEIALIRSVYETHDESTPFYGDESARYWTNVVYLADGNLQNRREVYRWTDELGDSAQGWLQSSPVYYRKSTSSLYYSLLTFGVIRNMETKAVYTLAIPKETIRTIFTYQGSPMYEEDGLVPVMETIPSPTGIYAAVVHQVFIMTGTFTGVYITAIGIFSSSGTYLGSVSLSEWNGTDAYLKQLYYPQFPSLNPDPPAFQTYGTVPTHRDTFVVWDGTDDWVFYVLNTDYQENQKAPAIKVTITGTTLSSEYLDILPQVPQRSTAGGPYNSQGKLLIVRAYTDNPNKFTIQLYQ